MVSDSRMDNSDLLLGVSLKVRTELKEIIFVMCHSTS